MTRRLKKSRLARKEEIKNLRRAYFFGCLTLILMITILFLGLPLLIRLAAFLGELKSTSEMIEIQDTTPPPPPQLYSLPKAISESQLKIEGSSEAGSAVTIYLNGRSVKEVIADKNSSFTAQISLGGERNEITLQAQDQAGNKSQESERIVVIFDNLPPDLEILFPEEKDFSTEEGQVKIQGKAEEEAKVFINGRLVILDQEGNFDYPLSLSEGENIIKIKAEDQAGNTTEKEIKITYSPF